MKKGQIYLVISALAYGIAPVLAKFCYNGGVNSITLTFLRSFLCLPILLIVLAAKKISLKLTKKELKQVLTAGIFGNAFMLISLYAAYDFIPVGMATVLHYIYPLVTVLACRIFYKEKLSSKMIFASVLVTLGIALFSKEAPGGNPTGIILALLAGIFYSFNLVYLDKSGLDSMNYWKLTFYFSLIMSATAFIFAAFSNELTLMLSKQAWLLSFAVSALITFVALPFLQLGVLHEGAAESGIISTLEPICSVVLGAIFLSEPISFAGFLGCAMILFGIVLTEKK